MFRMWQSNFMMAQNGLTLLYDQQWQPNGIQLHSKDLKSAIGLLKQTNNNNKKLGGRAFKRHFTHYRVTNLCLISWSTSVKLQKASHDWQLKDWAYWWHLVGWRKWEADACFSHEFLAASSSNILFPHNSLPCHLPHSHFAVLILPPLISFLFLYISFTVSLLTSNPFIFTSCSSLLHVFFFKNIIIIWNKTTLCYTTRNRVGKKIEMFSTMELQNGIDQEGSFLKRNSISVLGKLFLQHVVEWSFPGGNSIKGIGW